MSMLNLLISAGRSFSEWRRRERAYGELMALDDHSLADIGIHRSQIGRLVEDVCQPESCAPPIPFPKENKLARRKEA